MRRGGMASNRSVRQVVQSMDKGKRGVRAMEKADLLGAVVAQAILILAILIFISRLLGQPTIGYWLGVVLLLSCLPLAYLLTTAAALERSHLYYVQIGLMLCYLVVEFILDYVVKSEFRQVRWAVVAYITLFFAATGGMIGVASTAGKAWTVSSVMLFLVMTVLAFVQRVKTGM